MKRLPGPHLSKFDALPLFTMLTNPESQAAEEYRRLCFNVEWGVKETLSALQNDPGDQRASSRGQNDYRH